MKTNAPIFNDRIRLPSVNLVMEVQIIQILGQKSKYRKVIGYTVPCIVKSHGIKSDGGTNVPSTNAPCIASILILYIIKLLWPQGITLKIVGF